MGKDCEICQAGTYSEQGATACTPCEKGRYGSSAQLSVCDLCSGGTYALGGQVVGATVCSTCSAGRFTAGKGEGLCNYCPGGSYSKAGSTGCTKCSAGTISS